MNIVVRVKNYALLLAANPAVAGFIGFTLIGVSTGFGSYTLPLGLGLKWAVVTYIVSLIAVAVIAYVIYFLAPQF